MPIDDDASLAAAITALLADPARRDALAAAGHAAWASRFSAAPVVARWRDFLATVTA